MGVKRKVKVDLGTGFVSMHDAFEEFIADKELANCAYKTIENYTKSYEYFVEFEFDGEDNIDIADENLKIYVQQWIASMQKQQMRISSINHYLRDIRAFLYWCMHEDRRYIEYTFKIELVKGQEELPKGFTDEEVEILMQKPNNVKDFTEWRNWAIVNWVLATGNRAGTIREVKIGDIDFANGEIALRHTKSKKAQIAVLSPALEPILREYIKRCRKGCAEDEWLFPSITNEQLTVEALSQSFAKYCKERGVTTTSVHSLRHYFATSWIRAGGRGELLQKALGHSTYDMTQRYINLVESDLKEDYDRYSPLDRIKRASSRKHKVKL